MAIDVIKSIKESGGHYGSIAAWEAGEQGDLVAADERRIGELYKKSAGVWDENITIAGSTTDATRYRMIRTPASERHNGTEDSGAIIDPSADNHVFTVSEDYFHAEGLAIRGWVGISSEAFRVNNTGFHLSHTIAWNATTSNQDVVYPGTSGLVLKIWNCAFWTIARTALHNQNQPNNTWYIYNVTAWDINLDGFSTEKGAIGFDGSPNTGSVMHCKNVYAHNVATDGTMSAFNGVEGGGILNCTNCVAADNSFTGSHGVTNLGGNIENALPADQFVNLTAGSVDLHLKAGSACEGAGLDLSSDPNLPILDDIDGTLRTVPFDVGSHEFSVGGGGGLSIPVAMAMYRKHHERMTA